MIRKLIFFALLALPVIAQVTTPTTKPVIASDFGRWSIPAVSPVGIGVGSVSLQFSIATSSSGPSFPPVSANTPLLIVDFGNSEVVTPSGVNCPMGGVTCSFTATFTKAHRGSFQVSSGTFGLQEAINYLLGNNGGTVQLTSDWPGSTTTITSTAFGGTNVSIQDARNGLTVYQWNGSHYFAPIFATLGGNNVWTGLNDFVLGGQFGPSTFANLPASSDGTFIYCSDCQVINPCLGGGTGAFAQRVNTTWLCSTSGGGGGGTTPGGSNTYVQVNDNGVFNGFSAFQFNKNTSALTFPDATLWSPGGITAPNNALIKMDGNQGGAHVTGFTQPLTTGALELVVGSSTAPLQGGIIDLRGKDNVTGSYALIGSYDGLGHGVQSQHFGFQAGADELGFGMSHGWYDLTTDGGITGQLYDLMIDRATRSVHFYGPLVLPNAAGTGFSYGVAGAVLLSQGSATPAKWSSDISGVFGLIGNFGSCAGVTPSASQSAFCFGPAGEIQASYGGDTLQGLVRKNNIPATGITGLIEPSQIDLTGTGLGAIYQGLNAISQYNLPEGGVSGAGLQPGPFNDAVDNIVSATKPVDLAAQPLGSDFPNCAATGTTLNKLVKLSSSAGATCTVIASIADTQGNTGVCVGRCGTTGSAVVAYAGQTSLVMDGATTVNDWIINSPSVAGDGRDTGSTTCPTTVTQVIGRVLSTHGGGGTYTVQLGGCDTTGGAGGGGGSPGGANGQIQWNNSGAFAGFTVSGDGTLPASTGVLTITGLNGANLASLSTGIVKNTAGTGVPSIAVAGDFPTLNQNTTGSAASLSTASALPSGTTCTTGSANSNNTNCATQAYADRVIAKPLLTGNSAVNTVLVSGADFTSSSATATAITGLSWTLPANTAASYKFDCILLSSEATSITSITYSVDSVTVAPTAGVVAGIGATTGGTTIATSVGTTYTTTGSKTVLIITPASSATGFWQHLEGSFEYPSNASTSVFQVEVAVGGGTNVLTVKRGSSCRLSQ